MNPSYSGSLIISKSQPQLIMGMFYNDACGKFKRYKKVK